MLRRILLFIFILTTASLFAQENDTTDSKQKRKRIRWEFKLWDKEYIRNGSPTIELSYGQTNMSLKNFNYNFIAQGLMEFKLGYSYKKDLKDAGNLVKYTSNFLYGSYISYKLNAGREEEYGYGWEPTLRFGFGSSRGYGYKLGKSASILFYNFNAATWTKFDFQMVTNWQPEQLRIIETLSRFDALRFSSATEGGIIIPIDGVVNLQAMYDRTIVFPAHLVWKHLGSFLIETSAHVLIDRFVLAIMKSTPSAVPVVNFLLKNGLSYGIYELRKSKMNWPFNSDEPLMFDSFKLGLTFNF